MNSSSKLIASSTASEAAEAAALQSWLVANARQHRPLTSTGLMAWALAALQAQALSEAQK